MLQLPAEVLRTFDARGRSKSEIPLVFKSRTAVAQEAGLTEHKVRTAVNIAGIPQPEFETLVEAAPRHDAARAVKQTARTGASAQCHRTFAR